MGQAKTKKQNSKFNWPSAVLHGLREAVVICLLAIGLFMLLSLSSYQASDAAWSHTGKGNDVLNAAGYAGALFADVTYYMLGIVSFLFPGLILFASYVIFRNRKLATDSSAVRIIALRCLGSGFTIISLAALCSIYLNSLIYPLPTGSGGVIGFLISSTMVANFNIYGATLVLTATFLIGVTITTEMSWINLVSGFMRGTGKIALVLHRNTMRTLDYLWDVFFKLIQQLKQALIERRKKAKQQLAVSRYSQREDKPSQPKKNIVKTNASIGQAVTKATVSKRAKKEKQLKMFHENDGTLPAFSLLDQANHNDDTIIPEAVLRSLSQTVEEKLADFGITVSVVAVHPGPVITRFELQLAPGVKASKITGLAKDLARSMSVISVRVVEIIPGRPVVGLELPNPVRQMVMLREVLESQEYEKVSSPLSLVLGKDIAGKPVVVDLAKMPHLLVAGTTGSGKSVGINGMILSLLFKSSPDDVKLIMIDPKMLELSVYEGIPHLLAPVVTDMKEAANALKWCVAEMERRYQLMASLGVRNLAGYNRKVNDAIKQDKPIVDPAYEPSEDEGSAEIPTLEPLPNIVVVIDEFADMIMVVGKKVEELIARIAQKARAAGIHLILATQRPSVDVITGLIKANVPTRIAFQVATRIDSRTILDQQGAEQLLGQGDMLYLPTGAGVPTRVHGAYVADHEVHKVVADCKLRGDTEYIEGILQGMHRQSSKIEPGLLMSDEASDDMDPLYDEALMIITETRRASISLVQRRLKIGYNRAARLVEVMEAQGVVSEIQSNGTREVLAPPPVEI